MRVTDAERRALLAARHLPTRAERVGRRVLDVADAVGPLHATDPSTAFLQVHARADVTVGDIEDVLYVDRLLLRHSTLRRTVHLLSLPMVAPAHRAYNHRLTRTARRQLHQRIASSPDVGDVDVAAWLARLEDDVVAAVAALDRPAGAEVAEAVPGLRATFHPAPEKPYSRPVRLTSYVLQLLVADGRIARDRPRGRDFTSSAWTYAPIERWLPDGIPPMAEAEAVAALVRHHVARFPAASVGDLAWWTGLPKGLVRRGVEQVGALPVDRDDATTGLVLPDDDLVGADLDDDPRVALLPALDATPMGVSERAWFLGDHGDAVFDRTGNIGPTVWCRGRVVGGWTQREDGEVVTRLLEDVGEEAAEAVDGLARRTQEWLGDVRVRWRFSSPLQRELEQR